MSMKNIEDVLYLLRMDGTPKRSIFNKTALSVEHTVNESSILTFTTNLHEIVDVEEQLIYRGKRYIITDTEKRKNDKTQEVRAEISYMRLADTPVTFERNVSSVRSLANEALQGTGWTVDRTATDDNSHSVNVENESALSVLRLIASLSDLELSFDTFHQTVSFLDKTDRNVGFLLQYKKNIQEIRKRIFAPKTTVLYPYGKSGLTIEQVNDGKEYIENFDWYTIENGMSIEDARRLFSKVRKVTDSRLIYSGDVKREAEKILREEAFPQIQYDVDVSFLDKEVTVGDYGYVVDEELDIRVNVNVVRMVEYENSQDNKVELSYLLPDLSHETGGGSDAYGADRGPVTVLGKNVTALTVGSTHTSVVHLNISATSDTTVQVGLNLVGQAYGGGLLDGYYTINNGRAETVLKQTLTAGYHTVAQTFILTQIPAGTHRLTLMLKYDGMGFGVETRQAELFVIGNNLAGGVDSSVPVINVSETVTYPADHTLVTDNVTVTLE